MDATIYDSRGNVYWGEGSTRAGDRVKEFFFAGVRVAVNLAGRRPEIVAFFRGRESPTSRAEQFYFVHQAATVQQLFSEFETNFEEATADADIRVDRDTDDMTVFNRFVSLSGSNVDSTFELNVIEHLLSRGQQLRFGVRREDDAIEYFRRFIKSEEVTSIAISDEVDEDALRPYDLVFVPGARRNLDPLGDTERAMKEGKQQLESQLVDEKVRSIKSSVDELQRNTSLSGEQIRSKVHRQVPALKPPQTNSSGGGGLTSSSSDSGLSIPDSVLAVVLIVGGLVAIGLIGAGLGVGPLGAVGTCDIPGIGGGCQTTTITADISQDEVVVGGSVGINASVAGADVSKETESNGTATMNLSGNGGDPNGEYTIIMTVGNLSDISNSVNVSGTAKNHDSIKVSLRPKNGMSGKNNLARNASVQQSGSYSVVLKKSELKNPNPRSTYQIVVTARKNGTSTGSGEATATSTSTPAPTPTETSSPTPTETSTSTPTPSPTESTTPAETTTSNGTAG
jgi:hypothetical protein